MKKENRELAKKQKAKQQRKSKMKAFIKPTIFVVVLVAILVGLGFLISSVASDEYVAAKDVSYTTCIGDDGLLLNVKLSDYMTLSDYRTLTVSESDIAADETKVEEDIKKLLDAHPYLNTLQGQVVKDKDKLNIDYVGSVDGVEFSGGNTQGNGAQLTVGANSYIDDFEQQMIGHTVGETFEINATFPETYTNNPDLAGKEALFVVTINGIYEDEVFDDEFVKEYIPEYESTEAYKEARRTEYRNANLETAITKAVVSESKFDQYPKDYVYYLQQAYKKQYESEYEYYANMYQQMLGYSYWNTFTDYLKDGGMTVIQFEKSVKQNAQSTAEFYMVMQAIFEDAGLTYDDSDILALMIENGYTEEDFETRITTDGRGTWAQNAIAEVAMDYLKTLVKIQ